MPQSASGFCAMGSTTTSTISDRSSSLSRSDNFFIAAFLDPIAVGAYAFYVRLNEMTGHLLPTRLLKMSSNPCSSRLHGSKRILRMPRYFSLLVNIEFALGSCHSPPMWLHTTVKSCRSSSEENFSISSILLPIIVGFTTLQVLERRPRLWRNTWRRLPSFCTAKFLSLQHCGDAHAVALAGLYGAAIATGTAQLMKNVFIWWFVRRIARWTNWMAVCVSALAIWGGAVALCLGLKHVTSWPPIFDLLGGMFVVGVGWLLYIRCPAVSHSDREIIGNLLHGREARILRWIGVLRCAAAGQGK